MRKYSRSSSARSSSCSRSADRHRCGAGRHCAAGDRRGADGDDLRRRPYLRGPLQPRGHASAVLLRGRLPASEVVPYMVAQLVAAALAAAAVVLFLKKPRHAQAPFIRRSAAGLAAEFLFTFALVLGRAQRRHGQGDSDNSYYGLAIGFTVLAGAFAVGESPAAPSTRPSPWAPRSWACCPGTSVALFRCRSPRWRGWRRRLQGVQPGRPLRESSGRRVSGPANLR